MQTDGRTYVTQCAQLALMSVSLFNLRRVYAMKTSSGLWRLSVRITRRWRQRNVPRASLASYRGFHKHEHPLSWSRNMSLLYMILHRMGCFTGVRFWSLIQSHEVKKCLRIKYNSLKALFSFLRNYMNFMFIYSRDPHKSVTSIGSFCRNGRYEVLPNIAC
jgi:hypothetical protein